jgi:CMP-N,N'-diacetyllegionaminic acid synthase
MQYLGIIPARGGSKGVPRKNIKDLGGIPLIAYTIKTALESNLTKVIVSTDDEEIANIAQKFGAEVPFRRPNFLSDDISKSIDVARHGLIEIENIYKTCYDAVMYLQPTTPFRNVEDINSSIILLNANDKADSVISVVDVQGHHPARMKYIENGLLIDPEFCEKLENQNRQELRPMFIRNGAIYLSKRETILHGSFKGKYCLANIMPSDRSINIDNQEDFEYAKWIINKKF